MLGGIVMQQQYRDQIEKEFENCVDGVIARMREPGTYQPFHSALLSDEILFWSRFERSFSTSFGQRVVEELVRIVAIANGADDAKRQVTTIVNLDSAHLIAIEEHMQRIRDGHYITPPWRETVEEILAVRPIGKRSSIRIISDVWWLKNGVDHYISLKTVKPNIDQTAVAKKDCLQLTIGNPGCQTYFGLPYNPYGERRSAYAHNPPRKIFDFQHDPVVLIGRDLWDTIGGLGCYDEILDIVQRVGQKTKQAIQQMDLTTFH